ncbi:hypothetical protein KKH36_02430 [Patescibacteria group bacterium]|nr:hypothetical protein [Patescibacteria group bacterium]
MKTKQILKWPLIVGIVILLNLFFLYAVKVAYPAPEYDDFCKQEQVVKELTTEESCIEVGGQWSEHTDRFKPVSMYEGEIVALDNQGGYCDQQYTCRQDYETAREDYERNVFIALVIFGVISVVIGFFTMGKEVVSIAMTLGGVLSFIIASIRYWSYASDWLHLTILGVALVILILLAIKKFTE